MRAVTKHIVHCSDSVTGDVREIRQWHLARGWNDVGYHFVIRPDGEVEVVITPTYSGCPAMEQIHADILALREKGVLK